MTKAAFDKIHEGLTDILAGRICLYERIIETDILLTIANRRENPLDRIVDLACGHKANTTNMKRARCARCEEMLRRSIADGSEDYDSFRKGLIQDQMEWEADPLRPVHEPNMHD